MLIKFFPNGRGGGAGPVEYLTAETVLAYDGNRDLIRDASGRPESVTREPLPQVVRGNPQLMIDLIDTCPHRWTYRAGVVSFAREDAPTERQQQEAIDRFEEIAFAGLDADRYACLWVRHTHEDRVELHFCTPRMELHSGRSLNIAPPGYERAFDSLRDLMNKTHGWADPMDVERAAEVKTVSEAPDRAAGRDGLHAWVGDQISMGLIEDRAGMVAALTDAGFEVPRAGKNYLTVKDPETEERFRLKGVIFHENWRAEATAERKAERGHGADQGRERRLDRHTVAKLQDRFEGHCRKRAGYNQDRYGRLPAAREETPHEAERERSAAGVESLDVADIGSLLPDDQHWDFDVVGHDLANAEPEYDGSASDQPSRGDISDPTRWQGDAGPMPIGGGAGGLSRSAEGVSDAWSDSVRARIAELRREVDRSLEGIRAGIDQLRRGDAHGTSWVTQLRDRVAQITALLGRSVERLDAGFRAAQRQHGTGAEGEEAPRDTLSEDREDTHALRH
ncbi:relaxase/mobilization nuclease domain-containing protein [Paracoccus sp. 1_MG-2023]|uniref:relaxase/mobilization nuclease domain-containing protein n=1 Tax=unclassified Paracoccus (in: a-proteobacteria) TaxID=2688777 RepID=UPI001C097843|nr:relaxase/mobilization nuclease domain-containing protein [Paracoccus sp. 1_MG-2023]MBU2959212.1 relaxase/mobilization nuclease domain-containing protein [Paracoccus sp. C2R09]MDO6670322.1 relaxase/mobilization nuclease domain-containing protein [Paracoccus sp. 1_MG-2023]